MKVVRSKIRKIAVMLPIFYVGGTLRGVKNIARMIKLGSEQSGDKVEVVLSIPVDAYNVRTEFADLIAMGITVRETFWRHFTKEQIHKSMSLGHYPKAELTFAAYQAPDDGGNYFLDCDVWFLVSDRTIWPIAPFRPYGVLIYDYIQRYLPSIFPPTFDDATFLGTAQAANFVFCTTPSTLESAVQYAGVNPARAHLIPLDVDLKTFQQPMRREVTLSADCEDYFVWTTNPAPHKNHLTALAALEEYYNVHQGKLRVVMTGSNTHWLDVKAPKCPEQQMEYVAKVRQVIQKSKVLRKNLIVVGELSDNEYINTLQAAKFLWHPCLVDAGTFSCIEAAYVGTPTLSHNYPAMNFLGECFALNMTFCDARNNRLMARSLKDMELSFATKRSLLPSIDFLERFTWQNLAAEFWRKINSSLQGSYKP